MADTCICILIYGRKLYYEIGRRAVASMLTKTDFDLFVAAQPENLPILNLKPSSRVYIEPLIYKMQGNYRALPFLLKFKALDACLAHTHANQILLMDADTVIVDDITGRDVQDALDGHDFAMVEQTTIRGSSMTRNDFLDHYKRHTMAWFDPSQPPPTLADFRFFNSGVVLGKTSAFREMVAWALTFIAHKPGRHQVGNHMIADQDYFQYWTNTLHPGSCRTLPWKWNHCQHWDCGFPDPGAAILHFSNFCMGPDRLHQLRMMCDTRLLDLKRWLRRGAHC